MHFRRPHLSSKDRRAEATAPGVTDVGGVRSRLILCVACLFSPSVLGDTITIDAGCWTINTGGFAIPPVRGGISFGYHEATVAVCDVPAGTYTGAALEIGTAPISLPNPLPYYIRTQASGRHDILTFAEDPATAGLRGGVAHFGFRLVDPNDIDRAIAEVERAGGRLLRRGEFAPGFPYAYVADPDGYEIEIWFE